VLNPVTPRNSSSMPKPMGTHRPIHGASVSVLGGDTTLSGSIKADTDLHIDGRVEGDVTCTALVQGDGSEVIGAITAESARIAGRVDGSVTAREVVIMKSARIRGDIVYDSLTIEQGAQLDGRLTPRTAQSQTITRSSEGAESRLVLAAPAAPPSQPAAPRTDDPAE
jgi:cytoskeletal protein CcmA (bactofilin family)